jgi:transposase
MTLHLAEIGRNVTPGAHGVVIADGAGWHKPGGSLHLPDNLSMLLLPPCSPELNPQENVWQYLRQNYLSNRVFATYQAIVDACCIAWRALMDQPARVTTIASREWAKAVTI